jgi:hypothetical protein
LVKSWQLGIRRTDLDEVVQFSGLRQSGRYWRTTRASEDRVIRASRNGEEGSGADTQIRTEDLLFTN